MKKIVTLSILLTVLCLIVTTVHGQDAKEVKQGPAGIIGSTVIDQVYSPGLEGNLLGDPATQPVRVFLPPGYDLYPNNRYPVVYLLNGYTYDHNQFFNAGLLDLLNNMVASKIIAPMIVVTPNGKNKYDGCMYANSCVAGNWEDYIVQDVVQHVDKNYRTLNRRESRGLSGHSMGGHGTISIGTKHPSVYGSIALINAATLDFEIALTIGGIRKEHFASAVQAGKYRYDLPWQVRYCFALAVEFAPDSTLDSTVSAQCRFPFDGDGNRIDSTYEVWLEQYPATVLPNFKDSLLKLDNIQIYLGNKDPLVFEENESFHQQFLDEGIDHGFEIFTGKHAPDPVLDEMLRFFSNSLVGIVPTIRTSRSSLTREDTLVITSDMDGSLYIVPDKIYTCVDSIIECQELKVDATADEETDIILSGLGPGIHLVFAISNDSIVSNIPAEFSIMPTDITLYKAPDFKIFPNPVTRILNIETGISTPYIVDITSLNGQLILRKEMEGTTQQLDLSSFRKGIYFIMVRSGDQLWTEKILKL